MSVTSPVRGRNWLGGGGGGKVPPLTFPFFHQASHLCTVRALSSLYSYYSRYSSLSFNGPHEKAPLLLRLRVHPTPLHSTPEQGERNNGKWGGVEGKEKGGSKGVELNESVLSICLLSRSMSFLTPPSSCVSLPFSARVKQHAIHAKKSYHAAFCLVSPPLLP